MANTLLNDLRGCFQANGSEWVDVWNGVVASLLNGATVSGGMLVLGVSGGDDQIASVSPNSLYEFSSDWSIMTTFTMDTAPTDQSVLMTRYDVGSNILDYLQVIDGPGTGATGVEVTKTTPSLGSDSAAVAYTPATSHLYCIFGTFTPQLLTARLYSVGEAVAQTQTVNTLDTGNSPSGSPLTFGGISALSGVGLIGKIVRCGLWGRVLSNAEMDSYWNSESPLNYNLWQGPSQQRVTTGGTGFRV